MKNRTYVKASFREITQSKGRFIAISLIIFLGTLLFVGVKAAGPILNHSASQYVNNQNLADMQVISTLGITKEDEALAKKIPDAKVESGYQFYYANAKKNEVVQVFSYDKANYQNQLLLKKGRLPKNEKEIVLDNVAVKDGYEIGDAYSIKEDQQLKNQEYKIVGFVDSPLFISTTERGYSTVGNGTVNYFAYVPETNFKATVKSVIYIRFDNVNGLETYSSEYKNKIEKNQEAIKKTFKDRPEERLTEVRNKAQTKLTETKTELEDGLSQLKTSQIQLNQAQEQLNQQKAGLQQFPKAQQELLLSQFTSSESELAEQQSELDTAKTKLEEAKQKIAENEDKINQMKVPTYLFNVRADNPGFQEYGDLSERIAAIADVFPVFFFFIAALITFTTMTRMVEENRREIGTLKALGYTKFEISKKYIIYALFASVIGIFTGVIAGTEFLPRIIYVLSSERYTLGGVKIYYVYTPIIQATVAFFAATLGSALMVLLRELHDKPAQLMQARAPKPGKRIFLEYIRPFWSRLNFNQKVSYRNIFRYKSRMIMAIIGISGCAGLMVAGFGLKDSLSSVTDKQFGPIMNYQAVVTLDEESISTKDQDKVMEELSKVSTVKNYLMIRNETIEIREKGKANQSLTMNVTEKQTEFKKYIHMTNLDGKKITLSDQGAVITEKIAELYNISKGDELIIYDKEQEAIKVKIQDITENYLGNFLYLSKDYYQTVSKKNYQPNTLLVQTKDMTQAAETKLSEHLLTTGKVSNTTFMSTKIKAQEESMANLDAIVVIFVVLSGALAFVILYNLININVSERIRELSTIKVLGFFDKEVTMYIVRENIIFTLLGIVFGYGIGYILTEFILQQASMENVIFPLVIHWPAYVVSGGMTFIFTIIVMVITHFKLKHINMIDALKSNE